MPALPSGVGEGAHAITTHHSAAPSAPRVNPTPAFGFMGRMVAQVEVRLTYSPAVARIGLRKGQQWPSRSPSTARHAPSTSNRRCPCCGRCARVLGLTGTKFGCGIAACGACTVHLDGRAVRSCVLPISAADGKNVTTIEGLAQDGTLHQVQQAWIAHQVPQCGYCQSGMIMAVAALLARDPDTDRRGHRRRRHQHLPLRHVRARARGHSRRRPGPKERRHEQVDAPRLHRRRHRRRRRLPAGRRPASPSPPAATPSSPPMRRRRGSSRPGSRSRPTT